MFGCTFVDHGISSSFGNVISVEGQDGSIAQGTEYDYLYQEGPDNYVDEIGENGGTIIFKSQDSKGRAVCYSGLTEDYRAIHSTFIFGALMNGADTKLALMNRYMNYLIELTGIEEHVAEQEKIAFSIFPNPAKYSANINFSIAGAAWVEANVYNAAGQLVYMLAQARFDAGAHTLVWDITDSKGRELPNGSYILALNIDDDVVSKPIVILR
jgi:hypothetical protein